VQVSTLLAITWLRNQKKRKPRRQAACTCQTRQPKSPRVAKVLAVGPGAKQVKVGDRILYKSYSPTEVKLDGVEYLLVKEEDILATIK